LKLSTKGEYGLRAIFDLAQRCGQGPISLKSVAERQEISEHYLEQLIAGLRKAGLVRSVRGAQGGYVLARNPEEVTVGDVIRVLEGPIAPMNCAGDEEKKQCSRFDSCITKVVWEKVRDSINDVLDSITLRDMCEEAEKAKKGKEYFMYYI